MNKPSAPEFKASNKIKHYQTVFSSGVVISTLEIASPDRKGVVVSKSISLKKGHSPRMTSREKVSGDKLHALVVNHMIQKGHKILA